jgi:hypothetical protein
VWYALVASLDISLRPQMAPHSSTQHLAATRAASPHSRHSRLLLSCLRSLGWGLGLCTAVWGLLTCLLANAVFVGQVPLCASLAILCMQQQQWVAEQVVALLLRPCVLVGDSSGL